MFPGRAHFPPLWVTGHQIIQWYKCPEVQKGMRNGAEQDMHRQGVSELAVRNELNVLFN